MVFLIRRLDRQNLFNLLQEEIIPPETKPKAKAAAVEPVAEQREVLASMQKTNAAR